MPCMLSKKFYKNIEKRKRFDQNSFSQLTVVQELAKSNFVFDVVAS